VGVPGINDAGVNWHEMIGLLSVLDMVEDKVRHQFGGKIGALDSNNVPAWVGDNVVERVHNDMTQVRADIADAYTRIE
jgi:hypothetical protein